MFKFMQANTLEHKTIQILSFALGISICVSTALMSASYIAIALIACLKNDFKAILKSAVKQKFVVGCIVFYSVFICASFWSNSSLHDILNMLTKIYGYAMAPLLFISFKNCNSGKLLITGFIVGAALSATLSVISWGMHKHILHGIQDGAWVIFHGHILHNAFLAIAGSFLLLLVLKGTNTYKIKLAFILTYIICLVDTMFIVVGRTGQIMFFVMTVFVLIYHFKLKSILIILGLSILIAPLLYISPAIKQGIDNYKADITQLKQGNSQTSMGERFVFHDVSIKLFKQRPLLGYGTGSFSSAYSTYINKNNIKEQTTNPHRDLLWIGVETGIIGIIAFIILILSCILDLLKLPKIYLGAGFSVLLGYILASWQNSFFIDEVTGITFISILLSLIATGESKLATPIQTK